MAISGKTRREKGARAEREIKYYLQESINKIYTEKGLEAPVLDRNFTQSIRSGCDLVGFEGLAIEIKRQETLRLRDWWKQTCRQAGDGQIPVLFYRKNRTPWMVIKPAAVKYNPEYKESSLAGYHFDQWNGKYPVELFLEPFLLWFEDMLRESTYKQIPMPFIEPYQSKISNPKRSPQKMIEVK